MKYLVNIEDMKPDKDEPSLRHTVKDRQSEILRDTYFLIDPERSPSKNLKMGYTIVYPTGRTTGHAHDDMEEVYLSSPEKAKWSSGKMSSPFRQEMHSTYPLENSTLPITRASSP